MINRILWLGPMASDVGLQTHSAVSQAAVKYSRGLRCGLRENGVEVVAIAHAAEQAFPKGEFWPGGREDFEWDGLAAAIHYPNVKGIRDAWLTWRYVVAAKRVLARQKIDALVCYNVMHPYHVAAMKYAHACGIPCFPIVLDGDDPRKDQWRAMLAETRYARGIVFASAWMAQHYPGKAPVLHLDSGCSEWFGDAAFDQTDPNLIAYTGGLDHWRGLEFLKQVVHKLWNPAWRIVICGKCDRHAIQQLFGDDGRVEVKGFVSNEELHRICCRAAVFLSVRDPQIADNIVNFPSKIPNYLAYGKPVVSTWVKSFSEDYRSHLQIVEEASPEAFAAQVSRVMAWSEAERNDFRGRLRSWLCQNKLWAKQTLRMRDWIAGLSGV